jgi:hypothetical protein
MILNRKRKGIREPKKTKREKERKRGIRDMAKKKNEK